MAQFRNSRFGLNFSPNIGWLKPGVVGEVYKSNGILAGFSYGGVFEHYFIPNLALVTGFNILQTGGHLQYRSVEETTPGVEDTGILSRRYNLQYIEIPLMLKGSTGTLLGKFSFFGKLGIGNGFNIKAKKKDDFLVSRTQITISSDSKSAKKDVSFFRESLIIGIGAEYTLGKTAILQFGLTFSNGFTDILTGNNNYTPLAKEKAISNYVELNIGVLF